MCVCERERESVCVCVYVFVCVCMTTDLQPVAFIASCTLLALKGSKERYLLGQIMCSNKQRSFEPFICLDIVLKRQQSLWFWI